MNEKPAWKIAPDDKEAWEIARGVIEHEDGLINQRFMWLLVLNGFLFASFGSGVSLFEKLQGGLPSVLLWLGLLTVALLGIASGLTALNLTAIAFDQIQDVRNWWEAHRTQELYPPLAGFKKRRYILGVRPNSLIYLVMGAWAIMIVLLLALGVFHIAQ